MAAFVRLQVVRLRHRDQMKPWAQGPLLTMADMLTNLAVELKLLDTASGTAFADVVIDGHRQTWPIRSTRFRSWLKRQYYEETGGAPTITAIRAALAARMHDG